MDAGILEIDAVVAGFGVFCGVGEAGAVAGSWFVGVAGFQGNFVTAYGG